MSAGRAHWFAGEPERSGVLLESVRELASEPTERADLQQLLIGAQLFARPVTQSVTLLVVEAERVLAHDPVRACALFANASLASVLVGDIDGLEVLARRAAAADGSGSSEALAARMLLGI